MTPEENNLYRNGSRFASGWGRNMARAMTMIAAGLFFLHLPAFSEEGTEQVKENRQEIQPAKPPTESAAPQEQKQELAKKPAKKKSGKAAQKSSSKQEKKPAKTSKAATAKKKAKAKKAATPPKKPKARVKTQPVRKQDLSRKMVEPEQSFAKEGEKAFPSDTANREATAKKEQPGKPRPKEPEKSAPQPPPKDFYVLIESKPSNAELTMDGFFQGNTPLELPMKEGTHSVRVTAPGYSPWERQVKPHRGMRLLATLEEAKAPAPAAQATPAPAPPAPPTP